MEESITWIGLWDKHLSTIIPVMSAFGASFLTGTITYVLERSKRKSEQENAGIKAKNEKLEELFISHNQIINTFHKMYDNKKGRDDPLLIEESKNAQLKFNMIVKLYFSQTILLELFNEILAIEELLAGTANKEEFKKINLNFRDKITELEAAISNELNSLKQKITPQR